MKRFFTLLPAAALCCLLALTAGAQVVRSHNLIFSDNVKGGHTMFGNTSVAAYGFYNYQTFAFSQSTTLNLNAMNDFNTIDGRDTVFAGGATTLHMNQYYNIRHVDVDANLGDVSLLPAATKWRYHDAASAPSGWPATTTLPGAEKAAVLGFGTTGLATAISVLQTHYFAQNVTVTDTAQYKEYYMTVQFDDGFIVYVNGVEVKRLNMPAGPVSYSTPALIDSSGTHGFVVPANAFKEGVNTIQVEMHRFETANGDMRFSLDLKGRAVTTYNSSSSDLVLPAGTNNILFARLYWGGRIQTAQATDATLRVIKLRKGISGKYATFIANGIDRVNEGSYSTYQAYTDITAFVKANKEGTYTVANVPVANGQYLPGGGYGGWSIVVAYENTAEPFRSVRIYDGYLEVENQAQHTITLNSLNVPDNALSLADAYMSVMSWEGDANLGATSTNPAGDYVRLNNITVTNAVNPSTNFWNGTISKNGQHVTTKNPNYRNQLSLDIDELQVGTGYGINPGATSVTVQFGTEQDQYFPSLFAFSILMKDPSITINKAVTDINSGQLAVNDELLYTLSGANTGDGTAYNVIITDELPAQLEYIANSLEIKDRNNWLPLATANVTYNSSTKRYTITAYIGTGATATQGGSLEAKKGVYELRFRAKVLRTGTITNTALITARNTPLGTATFENFIDESTVDISSPVALPITMGKFGGSLQGGSALLQWTTLTEQNTLRFELERSVDGQLFNLVGAVAAQGNSNTAHTYHKADAVSTWGSAQQAYYRVKTIDIDGKVWYSKVIVLAYAGAQSKNGLAVFPNPVLASQTSKVQVQAAKPQAATIQVLGSNGLLLKAYSKQLLAGSNVFSLDEVSRLKPGVYYVHTVVDDQKHTLHIQVQ